MNWSCPYLTDSRCRRINGKCRIGSKGCVLEDKIKRAGHEKQKKTNPSKKKIERKTFERK
jgi:hypothetical protein